MTQTPDGAPETSSSDTVAKLVRMANQIAEAHRLYPEDKAIAAIRDHLHQFWAPVMLRRITAHLEAGGEGLDPRVVAALKRLGAS